MQEHVEVEQMALTRKPEILFVCEHNAGRSQMAAALAASLSGGRVNVRSAGSKPSERVHSSVIEVMAEIGVDLSGQLPEAVSDDSVRSADIIVTMGCGDACPVYADKRYLDWQVQDPAGKDLETVRRIRKEIEDRVRKLLTALGVIDPAETPRAAPSSASQPSSLSQDG